MHTYCWLRVPLFSRSIAVSGSVRSSSIIRTVIVAAAAQLQHHVDGRPRGNVVTLERLVVSQLLARMDQLNLIDLYALLFLQGLLDLQDLVVRFEIERLLATRQCLDVNLMSFVVVIVHQRACISCLRMSNQ